MPLLSKIICYDKVPQVLVLSPTQLHAQQIVLEARMICHETSICSLVVCGGIPNADIRRQLNKGVHLIVATTGKLLDLLRRRWVSKITYLI